MKIKFALLAAVAIVNAHAPPSTCILRVPDGPCHGAPIPLDQYSSLPSGILAVKAANKGSTVGILTLATPAPAQGSVTTLVVTSPPAALVTSSLSSVDSHPPVTTGTCEPHGDHWHCPPSISTPATPPVVASNSTIMVTTVTTVSVPSSTVSTSTKSAHTGGAVHDSKFGGLAAGLFVAALFL